MQNELAVDGLDELLKAGRRLLELDPERFRRVLGICKAYVAAYDCPEESHEMFLCRLKQASAAPKAVA